MSRHLQSDLDQLTQALLALAARAEASVRQAVRALQERTPALAQDVIRGDDALDEARNDLEEACLKILALHSPVAVDLRRVAAVLRIATELERIGDLAEGIAGRTLDFLARPPIPFPDGLQSLEDMAILMLRQALESFVGLDPGLARTVCRLDEEADRHCAEIIAQLVQAMQQDSVRVESGLDLFTVTRHLERIADLATNVAEDVIYLVEGEIVRHHPEAIRGRPEGGSANPAAS
jgi:phosphate transport system protein